MKVSAPSQLQWNWSIWLNSNTLDVFRLRLQFKKRKKNTSWEFIFKLWPRQNIFTVQYFNTLNSVLFGDSPLSIEFLIRSKSLRTIFTSTQDVMWSRIRTHLLFILLTHFTLLLMRIKYTCGFWPVTSYWILFHKRCIYRVSLPCESSCAPSDERSA